MQAKYNEVKIACSNTIMVKHEIHFVQPNGHFAQTTAPNER